MKMKFKLLSGELDYNLGGGGSGGSPNSRLLVEPSQYEFIVKI